MLLIVQCQCIFPFQFTNILKYPGLTTLNYTTQLIVILAAKQQTQLLSFPRESGAWATEVSITSTILHVWPNGDEKGSIRKQAALSSEKN